MFTPCLLNGLLLSTIIAFTVNVSKSYRVYFQLLLTVIRNSGARGLGNHMARACAEAGAKAIVIFDANKDLGDESAAELHHLTGLPVQFYKVDVRDGGAIIEAVNSVVEQFGAPDVLINSAGIAE